MAAAERKHGSRDACRVRRPWSMGHICMRQIGKSAITMKSGGYAPRVLGPHYIRRQLLGPMAGGICKAGAGSSLLCS